MFLKEHAEFVAVAASQAVQVEVDRFSLATSLLAVAARGHCGLPCAVTPPSVPEVLGTTPPDSVKAKFEKQVGRLLKLHMLLLNTTSSLVCLHSFFVFGYRIVVHSFKQSASRCLSPIAGRVSCTWRAMQTVVGTGCHAVQTAMTFPDWVAALDEMLPKLASAIRFALAAAALEGDKYQPAPSQKGKPGAAKAAAPAKKSDTKVMHLFLSQFRFMP